MALCLRRFDAISFSAVRDAKLLRSTALQKALPNCKIEWDDPAKVKTGIPHLPARSSNSL
jgi:hypothetical protein